MKLSADRQEDILNMMKVERKTIDRLDDDILESAKDLKEKKEEAGHRRAMVLALVRELEVPEQICTACGVVRPILHPVWPKGTKCPNCVSDEGKLKAQAALDKKK
jgi:hypothetical protein